MNEILLYEKNMLEEKQNIKKDQDFFQIELIRFKFTNQNLIKYLESRAQAIRIPDGIEKIKRLNEEYDNKKKQNIDEFIMENLRPTRAFVTFKWPEGADAAEKCLRALQEKHDLTSIEAMR